LVADNHQTGTAIKPPPTLFKPFDAGPRRSREALTQIRGALTQINVPALDCLEWTPPGSRARAGAGQQGAGWMQRDGRNGGYIRPALLVILLVVLLATTFLALSEIW
jgi:hypothetical protein